MIEAALQQLGLLFLVAAVVGLLARRLRFPYTVGLVLAGLVLALSRLPPTLHLSPGLVYSLLLPPLVFEAAMRLEWQALRAELRLVGVLATAGVVLAAAVVAEGMHAFAGWGWPAAWLFGALIAATDPVAVIATLRDARARGRLPLLIEAESLANDGTAAVLYAAVLAALQPGAPDGWTLAAGGAYAAAAGIGIGIAVALAGIALFWRTRDHLVELTMTVLVAYGSFHLAEAARASGILAAVAAGLAVGHRLPRGKVSASGRVAVDAFWDFAAFAANSLVFLLIGADLALQPVSAAWWPVAIAIAVVLLGRAAAIYPLCALFARGPGSVSWRDQHVLWWGGLRGALALALALGVPQDFPQRQAIVTTAFAVVAFSVLVQGLGLVAWLRQRPPA